MKARKQNSTSYPILIYIVSASDHVTPQAGKTVAVQLSKNGATFAAAQGAVTEIGSGWYALAGHAADRDSLGELAIRATASGCDEFVAKYVILPYDPFVAVHSDVRFVDGQDATPNDGVLQANIVQIGGTTVTDSVPATLAATTIQAIWNNPTRSLTSAAGATAQEIWEYAPGRTITGGSVASVTTPVTVGTNQDKAGYALSPTGLDDISVADPGNAANMTTLPRMIVALWRRWFKKTTLSENALTTFADNGSTPNTIQNCHYDATTQTVEAA
jgi:hypothetical protein